MKVRMFNSKWTRILLALTIALNLVFALSTPVQASSVACVDHYTIQWGDTLYKIGLKYGVSWPDIAAANGIGYPYTIYAGTSLCIPAGGSGTSTGGIAVAVTSVKTDTSVGIQATNLPSKENFDVSIGKCYSASTTSVGSLKTDGKSGTFNLTYKIPSKFSGVSCLVIYLDSIKSSKSASASFLNSSTSSGTSTSALDYVITDVSKNHSVTIKIYNAVKNEKYKVFIGKGGSGAPAGNLAGTFVPGSSKTFSATYTIPLKYKGVATLDLRIEGMTISASVIKTFNNQNY